ncbi:MAG TPA: hypothetical protein ENJ38_00130 [Rhodospirillales bacterium]|nr:hypothetical protein [Rhodospirillales bacterium]
MAVAIRKVVELRSEGANEIIAQFRRIAETGDRSFVAVGQAARQASAQMQVARGSVLAFSRSSRAAFQNVAFQLQDVVTQLSMGVPLMRTLAVQGPQIAGAFGPVGAAVGVAVGAVLGLGSAFLDLNREMETTAELVDRTIGAFDDMAGRARKYADALERATGALRRHLQARAAAEREQALSGAPVGEASEILSGRIRERLLQEDRKRFLGGGGQVRLRKAVRAEVRDFEGRLRAAMEAGDRQRVAEILDEVGLLDTDVADDLIERAGQIRAAGLAAEGDVAALRRLAGDGGRGRGGGSRRRFPGPPVNRDAVLAERAGQARMRIEEKLAQVMRQREILELRLATIGREGSERIVAARERELEVLNAGLSLQDETVRRWLEQAAAVDELNARLEEQRKAIEESERHARQFGDTIAGAFESAVFEARSLSDMLTGLANDLARLVFRQKVTEPLAKAITVGIDKLFGPEAATGAIVDRGRIVPFATGGIVDRPTLFPLRDGAGLMGEAGPEAIMPLRRLPDGRLGVEARGGSAKLEIRVVDRRDGGDGIEARELPPEGGFRVLELAMSRIAEQTLYRMAETGRLDTVMRRYGGRPVPR